eukprot:CAMPEP_0176395524 /NCGR_PEP_ID=MMETSP0126-20121128/43476_1 /TAXON_ID=141414 ORGANISM="Strombidinopsis acuminatum, Strain SPMC142" /NCGR_SAMPLE_ID=MMETSP0126 /ASSEMBLY_ACC=CAM_ASM_000229 /LENGTH=108 /DNA_ID=CAMNT_0017768451 /DNA_START=305 /DNA_END=628 /DNA_ORIENTATION=-
MDVCIYHAVTEKTQLHNAKIKVHYHCYSEETFQKGLKWKTVHNAEFKYDKKFSPGVTVRQKIASFELSADEYKLNDFIAIKVDLEDLGKGIWHNEWYWEAIGVTEHSD